MWYWSVVGVERRGEELTSVKLWAALWLFPWKTLVCVCLQGCVQAMAEESAVPWVSAPGLSGSVLFAHHLGGIVGLGVGPAHVSA